MPTDSSTQTDTFLTAELLRLALDSSGVAVWELNPETGAIECTAACRELFGLPPDQAVDYQFFLGLVHPEDRKATTDAVALALAPESDGDYSVEYRTVLPDGSVKWIAGRGRALFTGDGVNGKATRFIGTVRDVTERKTSEAKLQEALEQQQMLIKEVNHRVKNSLQLVSSLLRLQARRIADDDMRHQIEDAMTRISTIGHIHQRLYRDQDVKRIDFGAFLSELCADLQGTARHCALKVDAPHIRIPTDRAIPLALVTNELVSNAFKYAYPDKVGGPVLVGIHQSGPGEIAITVSDDGVGLPAGFTIDGARSLGMVLIGSLLGQLTGKIEILDRPKGANFVVTVPIEDAG